MEILSLPEATKPGNTVDDVRRIVNNCPKQRFALREGPPLMIRANQGHSMQVCIRGCSSNDDGENFDFRLLYTVQKHLYLYQNGF